MDPLTLVLIVAALSCVFCWIASLITKDTSWVDRIWSIVPAVYVWIFAIAAHRLRRRCGAAGPHGPAGDGVGRAPHLQLRPQGRLQRHGGLPLGDPARTDEAVAVPDLQPAVHRAVPERPAGPHHDAGADRLAEPRRPDRLRTSPFAALFLAFLVGEFLADQQQWDFHRAKAAARRSRSSPDSPRQGLFRFSRHPNFFFEQAQWWVFYALGATAAAASGLGMWGGVINWTDRRRRAADACCSSARRSSPSRSPPRSTRPTPSTSARRRCSCRCRPAQPRRRNRPDSGGAVPVRDCATASSSSRGTSRRS